MPPDAGSEPNRARRPTSPFPTTRLRRVRQLAHALAPKMSCPGSNTLWPEKGLFRPLSNPGEHPYENPYANHARTDPTV